jgi:D-alanyl-D-alanine dipeptidase
MPEDPNLAAGRRLLTDVARANGLNPHVTSIYRSRATQERLYRDYLDGKSRYPAAPPGHSKHEFGQAFDMTVNDERYLQPLGVLWESWGGRWGGRFNDPIHFELP